MADATLHLLSTQGASPDYPYTTNKVEITKAYGEALLVDISPDFLDAYHTPPWDFTGWMSIVNTVMLRPGSAFANITNIVNGVVNPTTSSQQVTGRPVDHTLQVGGFIAVQGVQHEFWMQYRLQFIQPGFISSIDFYGGIHITLTNIPQTITFNPPDKVYGDAPFALVASSNSGLAISSFTLVSGPATLAGNIITITDVGTVVVRANQSGNANYAAAFVEKSFEVAKAGQIIAVNGIPNKLTTSPPFVVSATVNTGLPLTFSIVSGPATIAGDTVTLTGATGTVIVRASQAGNAHYNAAFADTAFSVNMLYKSTRTAYCPFGQTGRPSIGSAESTLSQADADEKAFLNATQGLVCSIEPPTNATGLTWAQARYLGELGYRIQRAGWADHYIDFDGHLWWVQFYNSTSLILGERHIVTDEDFGENEFTAADWKCSGLSPLDLAAALLL